MNDEQIVQMFLPGPRGPIIRWDAHDPSNGEVLGQIEVSEIEFSPSGVVVYDVTFYYHDGADVVRTQRTMRVPRWQSLNLMGIMLGALMQMPYEGLCSDNYPREAYERAEGSGSVIPREVIEKG